MAYGKKKKYSRFRYRAIEDAAEANSVALSTSSGEGEVSGGSSSSATVYANSSVLPLENLTAGDMAFANNNNTLYLTNGFGWYKIALINQTPSITANLSTVSLGGDGNTALIGYSVSEPEGTPVTVSVANSGLANTSQGNVVLYTSNNTIEINNFAAEGSEWTANVILSVSDGVNIGTSSVTVAVSYGFTETEWFLDYNQGSGSSTHVDVAFGGYNSTVVSYQTATGSLNPADISLSYDGNKLYTINYGSDTISELTLNTAFDISSYDVNSRQTIALGQSPYGEGTPRGLHLCPDGVNLYAVGQGTDKIWHWTMSTPNDLTTATLADEKAIGSFATQPHGIWVDNTGTHVFICDSYSTGDDPIFKGTMTTPFDISTLSGVTSRTKTNLGYAEASPGGIFLNPTGTEMYVIGYTQSAIHYFQLSTAFDLSTATFLDNIGAGSGWASGVSSLMGLHIAYNETTQSNSRFYFCDYSADTIRQSNVALQTTATYPT